MLDHVSTGESNKDIAADLGIGEQAVKALVSRLLLKFGVPNRTTLAANELAGSNRRLSDLTEDLALEIMDLQIANDDLVTSSERVNAQNTKLRGEMEKQRR